MFWLIIIYFIIIYYIFNISVNRVIINLFIGICISINRCNFSKSNFFWILLINYFIYPFFFNELIILDACTLQIFDNFLIYELYIIQLFSLRKNKIIEKIVFSLSFKFLSTNTSYDIHIPLNYFNTPFQLLHNRFCCLLNIKLDNYRYWKI